MKRIFISTGEVSGDLQGALLIEALKRRSDELGITLEIVALGGPRMAAAGALLLSDTSSIGSIGLLESVPYIRSTLKIQRQVRQYLRQHSPDLVVMIDYGSPNLALGGFLRSHFPRVPTVYYIAPQEWVWSLSSRNTREILRISDRLLAIFPAEATYYQERGGNVTWVGHPLVDHMQQAPVRDQARQRLGIAPKQQVIALVPASRHQEIQYILPVICEAARQIQAQLPDVKFWLPLSLDTYRSAIEQTIRPYHLDINLVTDPSQTVIAAADLVIAKSGTVNLETALLNVPQVVLYRLNPITAWIAEHLLQFSAPFISPVNLVMMEPIVPELLQRHATPERITQEALDLLLNCIRRDQMLRDYERMRTKLGEVGVCDRAAKEIFQLLDRSVQTTA
ncbi:lipid-A-disaccharide synthase [Thermocoleostomius sinensis]|uniref:Lipid-A-disaccharide synthase n=1 Tax=Thermocoleostomius sinensis A174 TaxID=2016057 RepID=A0A9E8ZIA4_9CYAN|nr:lipid-A-disaccharide synthase [Thermocoleostomius sinensis]WAL62309.1 lipid-A-disaccharide synthase [Thermocoleostomius sinensis A174]